jgi:iron complex outermembrane receptor protein
VLAVSSASLFAQTPAPDGSADISQLEEIVVVGALREQRLLDAPMAVSSFNSSDLTNIGLKEPRELQFLSPSIQVSLGGANAIYIRGSGTNSQIGGTEQSVGLVLDGVLQGFVDDIGGDISDISRAEVFRGPQGTQFGKNASAGVVSIVTNKPKIGEFGVDGHFSYGSWKDTSNDVTVNVPISDTMAARITGGFQYRDGVFYNSTRDERTAGRQQASGRAKLLWAPSEDLSVLFSGDYRRTRDQSNFPSAWVHCSPRGPDLPYVTFYGTNYVPECNGALIGTGLVPSETNTTSVDEDPSMRDTRAGGASMHLQYGVNGYTLTSISAVRFMSREFHGPGGSGVHTAISLLSNHYSGNQISQELRIASPASQRLAYVGGVFLYNRDTTTKLLRAGPNYGLGAYLYPDTPYGNQVMVSNDGGITHTHNVQASYAGFIDGTFHITESFQLNGGFRVTNDKVSASVMTFAVPGVYNIVPGAGLRPSASQRLEHTGYTYRVGPQYFITPDMQIYGTFAHGYKGPLIDTTITPPTEVRPEEVDMFEAGFKGAWLNRRITLDVAAFYQKFKDYQILVHNPLPFPGFFSLGNAPGTESKGVEVEAMVRVSHDLALSGSFAYNDGKYTDYPTGCWNALEPIKQATTGDNGCYVRPGSGTPSSNAKGTPLVNASKYTYRLGAIYTRPFGDGYELDAAANYFHRSSWLSLPMDPNLVNPGYGVLNLNVGISMNDGRYRVGVYARNALDQYFRAGVQPFSGGWVAILNPEAVRTIGATFDVRLGN